MWARYRNNPVSLLIASIGDLIRSWWRVDRIRTSPREGRILRIEPGTLLSIDGELLQITERVVCETSQRVVICYKASSTTGDCQLWLAPESSNIIVLASGGKERRLPTTEIDIWSANPTAN